MPLDEAIKKAYDKVSNNWLYVKYKITPYCYLVNKNNKEFLSWIKF
jgi:hypothetical protein